MLVTIFLFTKKTKKEAQVGFEPTTIWLTAICSATELLSSNTY